MKSSIASWFIIAPLAVLSDAARILVWFPMASPSHIILGDGVVRHLAAAGHDITYVTPTVKKTQPQNVRQIDVSDNFKSFPNDTLDLKNHINDKKTLSINKVMEMSTLMHNVTLHNPNVRVLLQDTSEHFDLVIVEWMFSELYAGVPALYNAPYIWVSTVEPHWMVLRLIDEAPNPAYCSDIMSSHTIPFSFVQRVQQLWSQIDGWVYKEIFLASTIKKVHDSLTPYFKLRGRELPDYDEIRFNASLMFGNSHVSLGEATRLPQNYIPIGGYHISDKIAPLPEDLQSLLDNAKHGLIYFSMGSNLKSKQLPEEIKQSLLKMFGGLKQTVLWKFEEVLPGRPSNVHIVQWAPQPSILAHPNCVLFITHGGLLSTSETVYFAKPIIGIPVFADQFINVNRAVAKGFAKRVDLSYAMADDLKVAIEEMTKDSRYLNRAQELSFVYHHRVASPGAEIVHWVDHVVKTRGAPHLRSPAIAVPFYQKMYVDLAAVVLAVLVAIRAVVRILLRKTPSKKKTQ